MHLYRSRQLVNVFRIVFGFTVPDRPGKHYLIFEIALNNRHYCPVINCIRHSIGYQVFVLGGKLACLVGCPQECLLVSKQQAHQILGQLVFRYKAVGLGSQCGSFLYAGKQHRIQLFISAVTIPVIKMLTQ